MRPIFNATGNHGRPFTIYGTVWITFTPQRDHLQTLNMRTAPGLQVNANNVLVFRSRIWNAESFATNAENGNGGFQWIGGDTDDNSDEVHVVEATEESTNDSTTIQPNETETVSDSTETESETESESVTAATEPTSETRPSDDVNSRPARHFTEIAVTSIEAEPLRDIVRIAIAVPLKRDHFYVLKVSFSAPMGATRCGFSAIRYDAGDLFGATLNGGSMDPSSAVVLVPFPYLPSVQPVTFDLQVQRPIAMRSIAMARLKTVDHV